MPVKDRLGLPADAVTSYRVSIPAADRVRDAGEFKSGVGRKHHPKVLPRKPIGLLQLGEIGPLITTFNQALSRCRPLARRAWMMDRPALLDIR